jgi:GntR family transcriptional repressor for pyruvate dehydrogenase complex
LRALLQRLEQMDRATNADELLEADAAFHACIADGAGNAVLASVLDSFSARTYHARHLRAGLDPGARLETAKRAHHRIYNAVATHDPECARSSASTHVLANWLRSVVNEESAPPAHSEVTRPGAAPRRRRARN